jgi:hypothetical protein
MKPNEEGMARGLRWVAADPGRRGYALSRREKDSASFFMRRGV